MEDSSSSQGKWIYDFQIERRSSKFLKYSYIISIKVIIKTNIYIFVAVK